MLGCEVIFKLSRRLVGDAERLTYFLFGDIGVSPGGVIFCDLFTTNCLHR